MIRFSLLLAVLVSAIASLAQAASESPAEAPASSWIGFDTRWGGHLKLRGTASHMSDHSLYGPVGAGTFVDGALEGRITNRTFFHDDVYGEAHYEVLLSGGDTQEAQADLGQRFPGLSSELGFLTPRTEDDRRFLDLTHAVHERDDHRIVHRLDRLFLAWTPGPVVIRIGRQAATWGNGLLFNPMDLVNPFAPTDIEREYKAGDDMAAIRFPLARTGEAQVIYVPHRSPETGGVNWDQSSLAAKVHLAPGPVELDVLAARHYEDTVIGFGATGYAGGAAWRMDATWTFLDRDEEQNGYLNLVANVDYSWVWWEKNLYGYLEFFYSGLGESDPADALQNPQLLDCLQRGERFTLGRAYLAGHLQVEIHPLVNLLLTAIHRLNEPSGLIQPRAVWDVSRNVQLTLGATLPYGGPGTEFDGWAIPGTPWLTPAPEQAFLWVTRYF
ncbi:MAG: hypothetical protein PVG49_02315 [Desulfobacteraceae bacterium]|jgi:hypothetical protein